MGVRVTWRWLLGLVGSIWSVVALNNGGFGGVVVMLMMMVLQFSFFCDLGGE